MTRFEDALESRFFRRFMSVAYGLGASIVIIGALFKITHIKGANEALFIGMVTEAIIFALSALQRPHVEPDWSKVHPEFLEDYHGVPADEGVLIRRPVGGQSNKLDEMLQQADINQDLIASLGTGLKKLGDSASKLNEVSDASLASKEFVQNIQSASKSAQNLGQSYDATANALKDELSASTDFSSKIKEASQAATGLKETYAQASLTLKDDIDASKKLSESIRLASESAGKLSDSYFKSSESIARNIQELQKSTGKNTAFNEQLGKLSDNLASLNALYEMQVKSSAQQAEISEKLQKTMQKFLGDVEASAGKTVEYQKQMDNLTQRMASLNSIYGNMLSAMNVK
ncbi:MAG: gliding motility protein GldL [Bacteroidales bacterium]